MITQKMVELARGILDDAGGHEEDHWPPAMSSLWLARLVIENYNADVLELMAELAKRPKPITIIEPEDKDPIPF